METLNTMQKNEAAIERLNAEIARLDAVIPAKLATDEEVGEDLSRLEALQREKRLRIQAVKTLERAEQRRRDIAHRQEKLSILERSQKAAKASRAAYTKALEQILELYGQADALRKKTLESMGDAGFNDVHGSPAHTCYCDMGQIMRTLSHGGVNLPQFLDEIRAKLNALPDELAGVVEAERADLAAQEGEAHAMETK